LIRHWHECGGHSPAGRSASDAAEWARTLIAIHDSDAIVTPVYVEFVAGVTNRAELELTRAYPPNSACSTAATSRPRIGRKHAVSPSACRKLEPIWAEDYNTRLSGSQIPFFL